MLFFVGSRRILDCQGYEAYSFSGKPGDPNMLGSLFSTDEGTFFTQMKTAMLSGIGLLWVALSCLMCSLVSPDALARVRADLALYGRAGTRVRALLGPVELVARVGGAIDRVLSYLPIGNALLGSRAVVAAFGVLVGMAVLDLFW